MKKSFIVMCSVITVCSADIDVSLRYLENNLNNLRAVMPSPAQIKQAELFDAIAEKKSLQAVREAINQGVDVTAQNQAGETPLHVVAQTKMKKAPQVIEILIKNGARFDARDQDGNTPLHTAARAGNVEVVETLLKKSEGQGLTMQNDAGNTPLHLAVEQFVNTLKDDGQKNVAIEKVISLLLENENSAPVMQNANGLRPLDILTDEAVKELLKKAGKKAKTRYKKVKNSL